MATQCLSPKCTEKPVVREKWCSEHGEQLARVKAELEDEIARQRKGKTYSRRCRLPGCDETRRNGSPYCYDHADQETPE